MHYAGQLQDLLQPVARLVLDGPLRPRADHSLGSARRLALTLGLPTEVTDRELVRLWRQRSREIVPLPPRRSPTARCWHYMAAATTGPFELDELELAGGLLGEPVRVVRCETNDLEVPCDAEIVLEGKVLPHVREPEGPYSEFHDYYVAGTGLNPVVEVDCITLRADAIYKALQNGSEVEGCVFHKVPLAAAIYNHIRSIAGHVELHNVVVLPGIFGVVVQMTPRFWGEAKQVLLGVLSSPVLHPKVAIAVDEDVDVFQPWEVLWAINTRTDPETDVVVIPGLPAHPMDPSAQERVPPGGPYWNRVGGKVLIDATKPPLCAGEEARRPFRRLRPMGWDRVRVEDFLEAASRP